LRRNERTASIRSSCSSSSKCAEAATRELARGRDGASGTRVVAGAELLTELTGMWDVLRETSLLGRAIYEMRARHVLPPAVGVA
jgi:hypothetical protein